MRKTQSVLQGRKYSSVIESWPWMYKAMGLSHQPCRKQVKQWMGQEKAVELRDHVGQGFCSVENEMLNK